MTTETMPQTAEEAKLRVGTSVRLPIELFSMVEDEAKAKDLSPGNFILGLVAQRFKYTLPSAPSRAKKYATEEEKKAAHKEARDDRRRLVQSLMEEYKARQALKQAVPASA